MTCHQVERSSLTWNIDSVIPHSLICECIILRDTNLDEGQYAYWKEQGLRLCLQMAGYLL